MPDEKYTIKLHHWDYDKNERVEDEIVDVSQIARCATHENFVYLMDCFLNYGGKQYREGLEVGKDMRFTHRTLQRSIVAFALGILVGISEQEHTDPRNEDAIKTAKKIAQMIADNQLPVGPYL